MRWVRPDFTTRASSSPLARSPTSRWASAGSRSSAVARAAARWMAVGNTSLEDWLALTWSLGWTSCRRPVRRPGGPRPRSRSCWWTCPSRSGTRRGGTGRPSCPRATSLGGGGDGLGRGRVDHPERRVDPGRLGLDQGDRVDQLRRRGAHPRSGSSRSPAASARPTGHWPAPAPRPSCRARCGTPCPPFCSPRRPPRRCPGRRARRVLRVRAPMSTESVSRLRSLRASAAG